MFVTDTHPLVWYATAKHSKLSPQALTAFQKAESGESLIYVPAVVLWEIALLENLGKIRLIDNFERWAETLLAKSGYFLAALEPAIISQAVGYNFNNDLFDKVIVAVAAELDLPLITKDVAITESGIVEICW